MIEAAIICGIAGWRLASLLVAEAGPGDVFLHLREALDAEGPGPMHFWRGLFSCVWCMSVWAVPPMFVLWAISAWLPTIIAATAIAIAMDSWARRE